MGPMLMGRPPAPSASPESWRERERHRKRRVGAHDDRHHQEPRRHHQHHDRHDELLRFLLRIADRTGDGVDADERQVGQDEEEEERPLFDKADVLVKMERKNPTFQTFGITFTREHPYAVVNEDLAQKIIDTEDGFRLASPSEARAFYS